MNRELDDDPRAFSTELDPAEELATLRAAITSIPGLDIASTSTDLESVDDFLSRMKSRRHDADNQ